MGHELREDGAARQHPAFWRDRSPQAICPKNASAEEISSPHQIRENSCGLNRLYGFSCAMTGHQWAWSRGLRMAIRRPKLEIVPYDPEWPAAFEAEAVRLRAALGDVALRIDHHGSTSVPGLAAKPIIDIQVSVAALQPVAAYGERLETL